MGIKGNIIEVHNVFYTVKSKSIISNTNLIVTEGEHIALLGANGTGKTTLLDLILSDIEPTSGTVRLFGKKNTNFDKVGVVYDRIPLFPMLKVSEVIKYFALLHKVNNATITNSSFFEIFDIDKIANTFVRELSQGEKQRVGLLLSIIHDPKLLVLDEGFANLDPMIISKIWQVLKANNRTILFTAHNWKEVERMASKICFIYNGTILGPPMSLEDILSSLPSRQIMVIPSAYILKEKLHSHNYYIVDNEHYIFIEDNLNILTNNGNNNYSVRNAELKDAYSFLISKL